MRKNIKYMSEFVIKQYPVDKYSELILIEIELVKNFLLTQEEEFDYCSSAICSYEAKYSSMKSYAYSKIESLLLDHYDNEEKRKGFLNTYFKSYGSLNDNEQKVFNACFIDGLLDKDIMNKYNLYAKMLTRIKRSAIIKFCLKSGLYKFTYILDGAKI